MAVQTMSKDEAQIRELILAQQKAISSKNVEVILKPYAEEAVMFDVKPPFQIVGPEAWYKMWADCLPHFPATFHVETRDEKLHVGADLAVVHNIFRLAGVPEGHPAGKMWMRLTSVYKKFGGTWKIVHEHVSVPFNPCNGQAVCSPDPV